MAALIGTAARMTSDAAGLRDRTLANWVAMNELATLRLSSTWPQLGKQDANAEMGGRKWHWVAKVTKTSDQDLLRVDIDVSAATDKKNVISSLTGFIGRPMPNMTIPSNLRPKGK